MLRKYITLSAVVVASLSAIITDPAIGQQRMGIPAPKETSLPADKVELTMNRFHRLPMIDMTINGEGPYRMIVDTGAAGIVVTPALAKKLSLPSPPGMSENMELRVQTPGGAVSATLQYAEKLEMGGASFGGVWVFAMELPFGDDMDGVIGMNVFKECLLTFDYPNNLVVLSKGNLPKANGKEILEYTTPRMPDTHPFIQLSIDGEPRPVLIDSGLSSWFSVPKEDSNKYKFLKGPVEARMGQSVGAKRSHTDAGQIQATFEVGQYTIDNPVVLLGKDHMIGTLFLENFAVTFDAQNKRVRFDRQSNGPLTQPAMRGLGFRLKRVGDEMQVAYVHPNSDAAAKGLKVDGFVQAIDGKPVLDIYDTQPLRKKIQSEDSVTIQFTSKGSDKQTTIEIDVLELLK